ncbi:Hypothetical predicted protein [Mytilus galloprovincialis]|uniref:Uncharacterized protein n=1 Tax=Mytilus galloprovincialis TaxID=29158 RepID=A0A8B6CB96_MYTGA|nr:Hypothetical predicted protein [Mytilus galloprovincialis]
MARISTEKYESLNFYKYLCQKIGSEEVVRIRRFVLCIPDMSQTLNRKTISSGSKGEGLNLKEFFDPGNSMAKLIKIHGPCLSDTGDKYDSAGSIKCDKWVSQAQPWVKRPRTLWPSPAIISKIISCGVLFVPIGCKGSINENGMANFVFCSRKVSDIFL